MDKLHYTPNRVLYTRDANDWIKEQSGIKAMITSLPDMEEIGANVEDWKVFIRDVCHNIINSLDEKSGIVIFYQTDRKHKGYIIDKKSLISEVFHKRGYKTILNKIVLKQEPNTINLFRPSFTNLFGFSIKGKTGKATPDVIYCGKMVYKNAMGYNACKLAVDFIKSKVNTDTIVDPFCGQGSILKMANDLGMNAIGVDIDKEQVIKALNLK